MSVGARTPTPPYYAVIFTSRRTEEDDAGYGEMADRMEELASRQPGFLGIESAGRESRRDHRKLLEQPGGPSRLGPPVRASPGPEARPGPLVRGFRITRLPGRGGVGDRVGGNLKGHPTVADACGSGWVGPVLIWYPAVSYGAGSVSEGAFDPGICLHSRVRLSATPCQAAGGTTRGSRSASPAAQPPMSPAGRTARRDPERPRDRASRLEISSGSRPMAASKPPWFASAVRRCGCSWPVACVRRRPRCRKTSMDRGWPWECPRASGVGGDTVSGRSRMKASRDLNHGRHGRTRKGMPEWGPRRFRGSWRMPFPCPSVPSVVRSPRSSLSSPVHDQRPVHRRRPGKARLIWENFYATEKRPFADHIR